MLAILVSLFFALAAGSPFTLPGGLSNGLYKAYYNEAGQEVHERISTDTSKITTVQSIPNHASSLSKRQITDGHWCGCAFPMNAGDTNVANAGMNNWASSSPSLGGNAVVFYIQNTAVAFAINYDGAAVTVPSNMQPASCPAISYSCGNFIAGTIQYLDFAHLDYGYMNYFSGLNIMGAAESSTQDYCPNTAAAQCIQCVNDCNAECDNPENPLGEGICLSACRSTGGCTGGCALTV